MNSSELMPLNPDTHQAAPSLCCVHCCLHSPEACPLGSGLLSQSTVASGSAKDESPYSEPARRSRTRTEQAAVVEPTPNSVS